MPIAKETLRIGFTIAALPGTYVSQSAVDTYGWADKVEKGKDVVVDGDSRDLDAPSSTTTGKAAKK